jgi:transcriptional regulator with PAS, ATPase and Fis domain
MKIKEESIGSSLDDFLKEEGIYEQVTAAAVKRVIAEQIEEAMEREHVSKTEMAKRMRTSRTSLERLLDPSNGAVTLDTLFKAASAIGRQIRLELL